METYGQKVVVAKSWRTVDQLEVCMTLEDGSQTVVETKFLGELHLTPPGVVGALPVVEPVVEEVVAVPEVLVTPEPSVDSLV